MTSCAFYHCWSLDGEPPPYANLRTPVVQSISTLRAVSDVPIVVLDATDGNSQPWSHFPSKLDFRVEKVTCNLKRHCHNVKGWQHLSRIFDVDKWSKKNRISTCIYVDSDVFFFRDPFPLIGDTNKFCWDGWNTGFYYYSPSSVTNQFHEVFEAYVKAAIYSEDIRVLMKKYVGYDDWYGVWDEMVLAYMKHTHPNLFSIIPLEEHATARTLPSAKLNEVKMFHSNGSFSTNPITLERHARGLVPLMFNEFFANMQKTLDNEDLTKMYGVDLLRHYETHRLSLLENVALLPSTRDSSGQHFLDKLSQRIRFI